MYVFNRYQDIIYLHLHIDALSQFLKKNHSVCKQKLSNQHLNRGFCMIVFIREFMLCIKVLKYQFQNSSGFFFLYALNIHIAYFQKRVFPILTIMRNNGNVCYVQKRFKACVPVPVTYFTSDSFLNIWTNSLAQKSLP